MRDAPPGPVISQTLGFDGQSTTVLTSPLFCLPQIRNDGLRALARDCSRHSGWLDANEPTVSAAGPA